MNPGAHVRLPTPRDYNTALLVLEGAVAANGSSPVSAGEFILFKDDGDEVEVFSPPFRYVWPSELDLMARLAGMTLRERWGGWKRELFTGDSTKHVSVWEKPAATGGIRR